MQQHPQYSVKSEDVHSITLQILQQIRLVWHPSPDVVKTLYQILIYAAARKISINQATNDLSGVPSGVTVRGQLIEGSGSLKRLENCLNNAFASQLPRSFGRRGRQIAIDLVERPYHGTVEPEHENEVRRSKAKSGTTHFFVYATAYAILKGRRYTIASYRVTKADTNESILKKLIRRIDFLGIKISLLLLDRGFCSVRIIRYLQRKKQRFIMPLPKRGKRADEEGGPTATHRLAAFKTSRWTRYTMSSQKDGSVSFDVAVVCTNQQGRKGKHGREALLYATYGLGHCRLNWVKEVYKRRFGIESSYRQLNQSCIPTTSRNPLLRLLFVGLALLLRNIWVWLHVEVIATPNQGARQLKARSLRFHRLLLWLLLEVLDTYPLFVTSPLVGIFGTFFMNINLFSTTETSKLSTKNVDQRALNPKIQDDSWS